MNRILIALGGLSVTSAPLFAQAIQPAAPAAASATIAVGTQVTDAKGGAVGTVTAVAGDVVTVKTAKLDAKLDRKSFTPQDGKLLISMTQAELNAAVEAQAAAASAEVKAGLTVKDKAGAAAGTVDAVDAETVTIKLPSGKSVRVPKKGVAGSADGAVVGLTLAELEASAK